MTGGWACFRWSRPSMKTMATVPQDSPNRGFYSIGYAELGLIFDGAAIGQYLFGIDPFIPMQRESVGMINSRSFVRASDFGYEFFDLPNQQIGAAVDLWWPPGAPSLASQSRQGVAFRRCTGEKHLVNACCWLSSIVVQ